MLLIVFLTAYGVGSQALIDPYREFSLENILELIEHVFFLPYWQMYGELNLEEMEVVSPPNCTSVTSTVTNVTIDEICMAPDLENIRSSKLVTLVFLAVYLLIGNVVLLNLLIAIFTSVFEEVQKSSSQVWKWEMYRLGKFLAVMLIQVA